MVMPSAKLLYALEVLRIREQMQNAHQPVSQQGKPMRDDIITTVGIYLNGDFKLNGVAPENLESHINYNVNLRPGRALVVDGKIEHNGYLDEEKIVKIMTENNLYEKKFNRCTAPYQ